MEERKETTQDLRFWFERVEWEKLPKGRFDGTLFAVRIPLPIRLHRLDEYCAPYVSGYGADARGIPSLQELIRSEELTAGFGMHPEDPAVHERVIDQISFVSLAENREGQIEERPICCCYEQGWWCVSFSVYSIVPYVREHRAEHTLRAQALLELLGKPTCIMVSDQDWAAFESALRNGAGKLRYHLVYEREEYALVFRITDVIAPEFGLTTLAVGSCVYYAKPLWNYDREGKTVILAF